MLAELTCTEWAWLCGGKQIFPAMLAAIDAAQFSVRLETYIYAQQGIGQRFREAFVHARQRGVHVRVLVDAFGSYSLPSAFWEPLREAGGEVRIFNPLSLPRLGIRDHRKLLVCDEHVAFVGGFNIAPEYDGDGVAAGWFDLGLRIHGPLAAELAVVFDDMFARAAFRYKPFARLRRLGARKTLPTQPGHILLSGPGRERSPIKAALHSDLARARSAQLTVAYFLPTWHVRRQLARIARRGGCVQLLLAGKSDVAISRLAGQSIYRRLLNCGVEIHEYQPQILHAKLFIIDDVVYVGSANLDPRSLNINYELMLRFENAEMAAQARQAFVSSLQHARQVTLQEWRDSRSLWKRLKERWAYLLLVRLDPYISLRQWSALPEGTEATPALTALRPMPIRGTQEQSK
jgi:cardiolipin synthase